MLYNPKTDTIFCFECNKWLEWRQDCYIIENQILCLEKNHLVGYEWDLPEIFEKKGNNK